MTLTFREISLALKECEGRCCLSIFFLVKSTFTLTMPYPLTIEAMDNSLLHLLIKFLHMVFIFGQHFHSKSLRCYLRDFLELDSSLIPKVPQKWEGNSSSTRCCVKGNVVHRGLTDVKPRSRRGRELFTVDSNAAVRNKALGAHRITRAELKSTVLPKEETKWYSTTMSVV